MLGQAPPCLLDVVDRDVLQEPRDGVEPQPAGLVHVREPYAASRSEGPPDRRYGQGGIEHQRTSRSNSSSRHAAGSSHRPVCTSDGWTIVLDGATSQ